MKIKDAHLMEQNIVAEVGIKIHLRVPTISSSTALYVSTEKMNDPVLDFLGNFPEIHVVT
jgi:hypothetical protein